MTWNYRIFEETTDFGKTYTIREAYYDRNNTVEFFSDNIMPFGESVDELIEDLEMMLLDAKKYKNDILSDD